MPRALAFYRDVLGFEIVAASPEVETREGRFSHWVWLRGGAAEVMLNTQYDSDERPDQADPQRDAAHRDVTLYLACADIDEAYRELTYRGLKAPPPRTAPYGLRLFSVVDPDGYEVVFQEVR
jgi:uncharacterized glyoxalase superfamily protein PhnB